MLERIDRYELRERIGAGGQATVYLGHDTLLNRTVAVKVMTQLVSTQPEYVEGLMSEAQLAAGLSHQNIATVFDFKVEGDYACIVMEYIPNSLDKELQRSGAMSTTRTVDITIQICDGLAYAHSMGFVHRDIKPANILLATDGTPKVTDFGIARATDLSSVSAMGTPLYMSPEQCRGDDSPDIRSDIYSIGVMLYEMMAGQAPYQGTAMQLTQMHINDPTPDFPSSVHVAPNLTAIVRKCMEKDPDNRYKNAQEVASALGALSEAPARGARGAAPTGQQGMAEPDEPEPTGRNWRRQGRYTVVGEMGKDDRQGFTRNVQAGADEVVIVRKNGEIEDVYSEQRKPTRSFGESLMSLVGLGPNIEVYKATKTRFNIVFWLGDDDTAATGHKSFAFGLPVLTSDNQVIAARINLWIEVDEELAENTLLLLRGKDVLNRYDIASEIRDDLHAKVLGLDLNQHTFEELRGNRPLLREIGESIQREISGTLGAFGLRIQDYSISWGLTLQERADIDQQRHQVSLEQVNNLNEIERISAPPQQEQQGLGGAVEVILKPSIWARAIAVMSLIAAIIFFTINSSRVLEQARGILGIQSEAVVESIAPPIVVPPVVPGKGSEGILIEPKPGGGYQAVIPIAEVADLLQVSRLDFSGEIPTDSTASVETIAVNAAPVPPPNTLFVRTVDISIVGLVDSSSLPAAIEFHVMKQWLEDQSVSLDDVALFRHKGEWSKLETSHLGSAVGSENQFYERFSAETPGFSIFAVGMGYDQAVSESVPTVVVQPTATEIPVVTSAATATATVVPDTPTAIDIPTATVTPKPKPKPTAIPAKPVPVRVPTPIPTPVGSIGYSSGLMWGTSTASPNNDFQIGDFIQHYSIGSLSEQVGYFYGESSGYPIPPLYFGNVKTAPSPCAGDYRGYTGLEIIDHEIPAMIYNNASIQYQDFDSIMFGTRESECYSGLLPFKQGNRYGLIDPISIDDDGNLTLNWWIGDEGVTDFFPAPSMVTPTPTPVPLPTTTPVPTKGPVTSGPALKVSGETFRVGDKITVTYAGMVRKKDGWIGMFKPKDPDTTFKGYQKIGSEGSGSIEFAAPKQTGTYEFRMLSTVEGNPYNREAVSGKVNVLAAFTPTPTATVTPTPTPDRSGDVDGGRLDNNEPAKGAINYIGDSDEWNFNGTAGMGLTVSVNPSSNSDIDAYIELINISGNLETQSGGAGGSTNAIISGWILQQSGQYTARVSSASGTGGYTIEVSAIAAAEVVMPTATPTPLVIAVLPTPTATFTPTPTFIPSPTPVAIQAPAPAPTNTSTPTPIPPTPSTSLGNIRGTVLYNGNPLTDYTDKTPTFWTREENTNATRETGINLGLAYDNGTGAYILGYFEAGKYGIQVSLDNDGNGYPFPNDFYGWISPIYIEEGGVTVERDLTVKRNLHLTSPADNKSVLGRTDDPKDIYQGEEVKIEWDSLPEATQYRLSIYLYQESPYQRIDTVVNQVTSETTYIASLPESDDGQFYQLTLYADNTDSDIVGHLMINYENGLGWDYRFRTVSVPTPTPTPVPPTATPTPVPATATPTPVPATGTYQGGTLWSWGPNHNGGLGDGTTTQRNIPTQESTGTSNWTTVSAGTNFTLAIKSDGTLWAWGRNYNGQLGDGSNVTYHDQPGGIDIYNPTQESTGASNWAAVSAGESHSVALKSDGTLWAWGWNPYGQLGNWSEMNSNVPVQESTGASNWTAISAGSYHTVALKSDGTLWAWGGNQAGELGVGPTDYKSVPTQESTGASNWAAVAAGEGLTVALKSDGTLWAWGANGEGQLGDGTTNNRSAPTQEFTGASNWTAIGAYNHSAGALKSDGTLWAWGSNEYGQLGDGTTTNRNVPTQESTGASNWASISVGGFHTAALKSDDTLWAWGANTDGRVGDGTTTNRSVPVQESTGASNWTAVSAGGSYTIALK